jgi:hypothetical protein
MIPPIDLSNNQATIILKQFQLQKEKIKSLEELLKLKVVMEIVITDSLVTTIMRICVL